MTKPPALVFPDNLAALALARELGAAGIAVAVMSPTKNGPAAFSRFTVFVEAPDFYARPSEWIEFAREWAAGLPMKPVIYPTEDAALLLTEQNRDALAAVFEYSCAGPGVVDRITDKRKLYEAAKTAQLEAPESREVTDSAELAGLDAEQWLVKPPCRYLVTEDCVKSFLQTSGGAKALGTDPVSDADILIAAGFPVIVQEKIPGGYEGLVSVAISMDRDGRVIDSFCARKQCEYPEPYGDGLLVELIHDVGLVEQAARLLRTVNYWGICDVEFKVDSRDGSHKLLDANPRGWLWMGLGTTAGHRLATTAYEIATGIELPRTESPPPASGRWVSARGTAAFLAKTYRPARHGLLLPFKLLGGIVQTAVSNLRAYGDPLYARHSAWHGLLDSVRASRAKQSRSEPTRV